MVWFLGTIVTLMPGTALVSFRTLAFFFPQVTGTFSSFNATHSLSILDHCSCFNLPMSGRQNFAIEVFDLYSSSPLSSIFDNWASIFSDESPCRAIPTRFRVARTDVFSMCTDCPGYHRRESLTWIVKLRPILFRIPEHYRHEGN